ncbi:MAG: hypothetical protein JNM55_16120 [Anaerolineales bacterium]|nr:hypothetical protein [Anaerolineales bacterium]
MISNFSSRVLQRLRHWANWRCKEPVVVFESDDWGLERKACAELLQPYGEPSEWAYEQTESEDDLEKLYNLLENHKDEDGRHPCFTANFVTANPDFEKIRQGGFTEYYDISINDQDKKLRSKWLEGMERMVFHPQFHARSHFWTAAWLRDLRENVPGARHLFYRTCCGGLSLLKQEEWRYHSEYIFWKTAEQMQERQLHDWLERGLAFFQDCFGYPSLSTIAPNYVFTPVTVQAWSDHGIKFIQGAGYRIVRGRNGEKRVISHVLGERLPGNLLSMVRNVKFDPRPQRRQHGFRNTFTWIKKLLPHHIPIMIDTHRINYVGAWKEKAFEELNSLLHALKPYHPRFLTTTELGQAILNHGTYTEIQSGKTRQLTPIDTPFQKTLRGYFQILERSHANIGPSKLR